MSRLAAVLALAILLGACGSGGGPVEACPNDLPAACPSKPPSYATQVSAIMSAVCVGCHRPGGSAPSQDLSSWAGVYHWRGDVLHQIYSCKMPPQGEPTPTVAERETLLAWFVCDAPNN